MRRFVVIAGAAACAVAAVLAWAELVSWRASQHALGDGTARGGTRAVVILGYRNRGRRVNLVNRYRVRLGLRSLSPDAERSYLVLCGGSVAGDVSEAILMAAYARDRGYIGELRLDAASTTTAENIRDAIPLLSDADTIAIVSNPSHAAVGREYLHALRPDLAARLVRGADHRLGEAPVLKVAAAVKATTHRGRVAGTRRRNVRSVR